MKGPLLFLFFLMILPPASWSQVTYFNRQYDYQNRGEISTALTELDSTYLIVGGTSVDNGSLVLHLDRDGEVLELFSIPPPQGWYGVTPHGVFPGGNNDYFIQGTVVRYEPTVEAQIFINNYDLETHEENWSRFYGSDTLLEGTSQIIQTSDGGFAVTGWAFREEPFMASQIYLMKMDSAGELEYYKRYTADPNRKTWGISLVETPDNGFLILGFERRWQTPGPGVPSSVTDLLLLKVNSEGEEEWLKFHRADIDNFERIRQPGDMILKEDGSVYVCGTRGYFEPYSNQRYELYKFDEAGELLWNKQYGFNQWCHFIKMIKSNNSNLVFAGYELDYSFQEPDRKYGVIASTTAEGDSLWLRKYYMEPQGADVDQFNYVLQTPDGGYLAVGDTYGQPEDSTYQNIWVIKTDSLGCLEPDCDGLMTSTPERPTTHLSVQLYPNPSSNRVTIQLEGHAILLGLQLYDLSGRRIEDIQFFRAQGLSEHTLSLEKLATGIYPIRIHTDQGWWSGRVIKH